MIRHNRGNRRKTSYLKARRKKKITEEIYGIKDYYNNLHEYSKGKIHCSCPMCSSKTNDRINKSKGPIDQHRPYNHLGRLPVTNKRRGKNYTHSDAKKIESMKHKEFEYFNKEAI